MTFELSKCAIFSFLDDSHGQLVILIKSSVLEADSFKRNAQSKSLHHSFSIDLTKASFKQHSFSIEITKTFKLHTLQSFERDKNITITRGKKESYVQPVQKMILELLLEPPACVLHSIWTASQTLKTEITAKLNRHTFVIFKC